MDGTISPIVNTPDLATVSDTTRDLLSALRHVLPLVAVVSGRAVADLRARVDVPGLVYIGNHGLEWWAEGTIQIIPEVAPYRPSLEAALQASQSASMPGMILEDKGVTISIHYRLTANPDAAEVALRPVMEEIAAQHDLELYQGRRVFELRPPVAVNKGSALLSLVKEHQLEAAVFIGDDTTDVDAFLAAHQLRQENQCDALGVGVESSHMPEAVRTSADLFASGVQDIELFLTWLLKARRESAS